MRKLATICTISSICPIENADKLEYVTFDQNSWQVVVGKDQFKVNDRVVYFEIDSVLRKEERYSILEGRSNIKYKGEDCYKIRTMRLRGQISQGFCLPIDKFPEIIESIPGLDVTELLRVQLYEDEIDDSYSGYLGGKIKGGVSGSIQKTGLDRIQSLSPEKLFSWLGHTFEITRKRDGFSASYAYKQALVYGPYTEEFCVFKHNVQLEEPQNESENDVYWDMVVKYGIDRKLSSYCTKHKKHLVLQGEICGLGIQKNRECLNEYRFEIFDIFDISKSEYLLPKQRLEVIEELNDSFYCDKLSNVPIIDSDFDIWNIGIKESLECKGNIFESQTKLMSSICTVVKDYLIALSGSLDGYEGIVLKSNSNPHVRMKIISNKYLLKHNI
jgi:RNA ligase (TIGR02306 family)